MKNEIPTGSSTFRTGMDGARPSADRMGDTFAAKKLKYLNQQSIPMFEAMLRPR